MRTVWGCVCAALLGAISSARAASLAEVLPPDAARFDPPPAFAGPTLRVPVPDGRTLEFSVRRESPETGVVGLRGRGAGGERLSLFADGGRVLSGDIHAGGGHYRLFESQGAYWWAEAGATDMPGAPLAEPYRPAAATAATAAAPTAEPGADGNYAVDVLVLYTPLAHKRVGGSRAARAEAQRLVFLANGYFENSHVPVRYWLVGVETFKGTGEGSGYYDNLEHLASSKAAAKLRDAVGADLVGLIRTQDGEADLCGLSAGFDGEDRSDPPADVVPERDGFMVAGMVDGRERSRCPDFVFAHELAHNLGAGHQSLQYVGIVPDVPPGAYYWRSYAHGWQCMDQATRHVYNSIMHTGVNYYELLGGGAGIDADRGDFFSNPNLILEGQICGAVGPEGTELTEADNARAMTEAAPYVAAYRNAKDGGKSGLLAAGAGSPAGAALLLLGALLRRLCRRRPVGVLNPPPSTRTPGSAR